MVNPKCEMVIPEQFPLSNVAWLPTNCNPSPVFLVSSSLALCFALNLSKAQPLKEIEFSLLLMSHVWSLFHGLTLTFLSKNFLLPPRHFLSPPSKTHSQPVHPPKKWPPSDSFLAWSSLYFSVLPHSHQKMAFSLPKMRIPQNVSPFRKVSLPTHNP